MKAALLCILLAACGGSDDEATRDSINPPKCSATNGVCL